MFETVSTLLRSKERVCVIMSLVQMSLRVTEIERELIYKKGTNVVVSMI